MPSYAMGDRITFTGEASAEFFGLVGVVLKRRSINGHYVYDIKLRTLPNINILVPGIKIGAKGTVCGIPASWLELER